MSSPLVVLGDTGRRVAGLRFDPAPEAAHGAPLLLVHGAAMSVLEGLPVALGRAIAGQGRAVLCPNLEAHDLAYQAGSRTLKGWGWHHIASPLAELAMWRREQLKTEAGESVLAGHSWGALLAAELAVSQGARALVLLSPMASYKLFAELAHGDELDAALTTARQLIEDGRGDAAVRSRSARAPLPFMSATTLEALATTSTTLDSLLAMYAIPTLVIAGQREHRSVHELADRLEERHAHVKSRLVPDEGHFYGRSPEFLAAVIEEWLQACGV